MKCEVRRREREKKQLVDWKKFKMWNFFCSPKLSEFPARIKVMAMEKIEIIEILVILLNLTIEKCLKDWMKIEKVSST